MGMILQDRRRGVKDKLVCLISTYWLSLITRERIAFRNSIPRESVVNPACEIFKRLVGGSDQIPFRVRISFSRKYGAR